MNWSEELPDNCPPSNAEAPDNNKVYYRMARSNPLSESDFYSQAKVGTKRAIQGGGDPCVMRGGSVYDDVKALANRLGLPQAGKYIVEFTLNTEDGVVLEGRDHHWTWWKTDKFSISRCTIVEL